MMKKRIYLILTGLLCAAMLSGACLKTAQMRAFAEEPVIGEEEDPDAGFGDLPVPPSAADAKEDVDAILQDVEQEKEEYREKTDVSGVRYGMILGGVVLIGIGGVAVYYFKFKDR